MTSTPSAYLIARLDDGFGEVHPLSANQRYTIGRGHTNRIVVSDDLCSREHAEVYCIDGRWCIQDLNSLNGTRLNGEKLDSEWQLSARDEIGLGHTALVFVENMGQLPDVPGLNTGDSVTIRKRLRQTRFLTPITLHEGEETNGERAGSHHVLSRDLSLLYRLAIDMGSAATQADLVRVVLEGLLAATPADAGAILTLKDDGRLDLAGHRHRDSSVTDYVRVSQSLSREVLESREAILAEDVSLHPELQKRDSIREVGASSVICAPVTFQEKALGIVHLYCLDGGNNLDEPDLEFVLAVARQFGAAAHQLQRQASLRAQNRSLRDQLRVESELVGTSAPIRGVIEKIGLVAGTNATVLIRGESGVGKELVARAIHYSSQRKEGPFVCLNCAALPESLLESELFGHEKGAFTGATEKKVGKFEAANRGTIFLDEIGELNPPTQAKLLRVLEGHPFERIGGHSPVTVDVRVVAATNQPLEQAIKAGRFRRDLFFRLQVVEITAPPLRDRPGDVPALANHFLNRFVQETGRRIVGFSESALDKMAAHSWPGNVRELRNVVERAVALGGGPLIEAQDIWLSSLDPAVLVSGDSGTTFQPMSIEAVERRHIMRTLQHTNWNKSQAAAILQIERSTLDRKIKTYDLKR